MSNKKPDPRKAESGQPPEAEPDSSAPESHNEKRAKSRRLVLKSIVTGGAVTTAARSLPEKWSRPITESVLMPAHAQASPGVSALACRVETFASDPNGEDTVIDPPLPASGGSTVDVTELVDPTQLDADRINIDLGGVGAVLDPAGAGDVTLTLSAGGDFTLNSSASQDVTPNDSGAAAFPSVDGDLDPTGDRTDTGDARDSDTSQGNLELQFSAPDADDCVIQFTFTETRY